MSVLRHSVRTRSTTTCADPLFRRIKRWHRATIKNASATNMDALQATTIAAAARAEATADRAAVAAATMTAMDAAPPHRAASATIMGVSRATTRMTAAAGVPPL